MKFYIFFSKHLIWTEFINFILSGFKANYKSIQTMSDVPESAVEIPENVTSSTVSDLTKRKYPDGGYGKTLTFLCQQRIKIFFSGWTIVFCSFLLYLIADGISYPLGLINSAWLDYFHQSETKTSWIGSIFYATPLLSGPFMSKLIEKYGCKKMTMLGGAIGSLGFICSSLCTSVEQLYVTVGLIGGSGLSAAFIVGLLSVERWFESRRGFAIGIVSAGTGFGTFIFPPITQFLLEKFEWKLTMIFLSGLLMTVAIIGAFLDDPVWKVQEDAAMRVERRETKERNVGNPPIEKKFIEQVKTFVDFSHFKNGNFALLGFTTFIIYAFYNTAIYFLVEMLKEFQYTENESAKFLSVTGFFLMLGMLSLGKLNQLKNCIFVLMHSQCFSKII